MKHQQLKIDLDFPTGASIWWPKIKEVISEGPSSNTVIRTDMIMIKDCLNKYI